MILAYLEDKEHFENLKETHRDDAQELAQIESDEKEEFDITKKIIKELMYNGADRTVTVSSIITKTHNILSFMLFIG